MPGMYPDSGSPDLLTPWSERRMPVTSPFSMSGSATGIPGQIWTVPVAISCEPTHWLNCPMENTRPSCLWRKEGVQGSSKRVVAERQQCSECADSGVADSKSSGTAAGSDGIEQVNEFLVRTRGRHRDLGGVEIGKRCPDAAGAGYDAGDAEADVVGTLVADHLQRHAGSGVLSKAGVPSSGIINGAAEGSEEAAHRGAEADAGDIDFHLLTARFAVEVPLANRYSCGIVQRLRES